MIFNKNIYASVQMTYVIINKLQTPERTDIFKVLFFVIDNVSLMLIHILRKFDIIQTITVHINKYLCVITTVHCYIFKTNTHSYLARRPQRSCHSW